jgi:hypothetical protein
MAAQAARSRQSSRRAVDGADRLRADASGLRRVCGSRRGPGSPHDPADPDGGPHGGFEPALPAAGGEGSGAYRTAQRARDSAAGPPTSRHRWHRRYLAEKPAGVYVCGPAAGVYVFGPAAGVYARKPEYMYAGLPAVMRAGSVRQRALASARR